MTTSLKSRLIDTLEAFSGERPDLAVVQAAALPLFLRERFSLFSTRLFGRQSILALEDEEQEIGSPGEYGKHAESLQRTLGEPIVLVLHSLPSYARNRMVQMGIPFMVPGSQTFIPNGLIDLRERFPPPSAAPRAILSPAAQCTVLFHLLRGPVTALSLKDIARKIQYSPMRMTTVAKELEAAGICRTLRQGRALRLEFPTTGHPLWEQLKPHLSTPVTKTRWLHWDKPPPPALLAGMSALSRCSQIADDRLPTYAVASPAFQELRQGNLLQECPDAENAAARLEIWAYPPPLLTEQDQVDPLSLILSLRASADERVQQQLKVVEEQHPW